LNPYEGGVANKVNEFDQSCMLDHSFWRSLHPLLDALKTRTAGEPLWRFSYPELARSFKAVVNRLKIEVVPYQARHSGASHDRLNGVRDMASIRRRGGWKTDKSLQRYEKHALLSKTWEGLSAEFKAHAKLCHDRFVEILLDGRAVPASR